MRSGVHMFSIIIAGGTVYDGEGNPPRKADLGIVDDRIKEIGSLSGASSHTYIDATGKYVSPGFIDMHSHGDLHILHDPWSLPKLMQGVTTEVTGNCGFSLVPVREDDIDSYRRYLEGVMGDYTVPFRGTDLQDYCAYIRDRGTGVNMVPLAGHGSLRRSVMGMKLLPDADELRNLCEATGKCLQDGFWGLSTGLGYPPACHAQKKELEALCRVVKEHEGIFTIHMRSEGDGLIESIEEALSIASSTGVSLEISHLKAFGEKNWHKLEEALRIIEDARRSGIAVTFDSYPYTYSSTLLSSLLPPSLFEKGEDIRKVLRQASKEQLRTILQELSAEREGAESFITGGGWHHIIFAGGATEVNRSFEGRTIVEIGETLNLSPQETLLSLLRDEGSSAVMLVTGMSEECVEEIMKQQCHIVGSDGLYSRKPHPRTYGTFARVLHHYVKKKKSLATEEALRHMTSSPAVKLGLRQRGSIKKDYFADIVVFDWEKIEEKASMTDPCLFPEGIWYVLVNGTIVVEKSATKSALPGRILRREA